MRIADFMEVFVMKKWIAAAVALIWLLSCAGLAESVAGPVALEDRSLLIRFDDSGSESYVLIGAGDGTEVFDAFASSGDDYDARYASLWSALSLLEPALTVDGALDALGFESVNGAATVVSVNGVEVAELADTDGFAIFSEEVDLDGVDLAIDDACEVSLWQSESEFSVADSLNICPNCGEVNDGSSEHTTLISEFCDEGHTLCMGDPIHHCDSCGEDYPCSKSNSHTTCIVCGEPWCYKDHGDHTEQACGHRGCEIYGHEADHAQCPACGGYLCDGEDHTLGTCGAHHAGDAGDHSAANCGTDGHYNCDGLDHSAASCGTDGHYNCDGLDHSAASCGIDGHYNCDGLDHSACESEPAA